VAEFPTAQNYDALAAIAVAEAAWPMWKATPAPERGWILARAAAIALERRDEIATLLTREEGKILSGMAHVNEPSIGGEAQLPFGGVGITGVGDREMGEEGVNFFTQLKTVFINDSLSGARSMTR